MTPDQHTEQITTLTHEKEVLVEHNFKLMEQLEELKDRLEESESELQAAHADLRNVNVMANGVDALRRAARDFYETVIVDRESNRDVLVVVESQLKRSLDACYA